MKMKNCLLLLIFCCALLEAGAQAYDFENVPGVVINHEPAANRRFLGSPSICILPDGTYIVSHDYFGPNSNSQTSAVTNIFRSEDQGRTWVHITTINQFWGGLFYHSDYLYIMGTDNQYGNLVIRRSADGGRTWTDPGNKLNGLIRNADPEKGYHTSAVSVLVANGRIWRPFEVARRGGAWGNFESLVISAPVNSDLLNAANWKTSTRMSVDAAWGEEYGTWLEGGAVLSPDGKVLNILRVNNRNVETAAIIHVSDNGEQLSFNPVKDFIDFPGGCKKFVIRYDEKSRRYWSLSNWVPDEFKGHNPERTRNTLALVSSPDLREWTVHEIILQDSNVDKVGFQYVDWLIEGMDIIFVSRTAFFDGTEFADNQHNSNFITFHRVVDFRKKAAKNIDRKM
jgi:hypothetical protein